jgi:hypothetical protein
MTAPKRIDLARIAAGVAEALEKVTPHQVTSVNAELEELIDGTRHIGISALIKIPGSRRGIAIAPEVAAEPSPDPDAWRPDEPGSRDNPVELEEVAPEQEEPQQLPVIGEVPGPAPKGMKRGQTFSVGEAELEPAGVEA